METDRLPAGVHSSTGTHYAADIPPLPGDAYKAARYTLYVPEKARRLRCLILHQHGCSTGAERAGETASFDLQWQALADRHDAALLGSSYRMDAECADWSNPNRGTARAFLKALDALAHGAGRPEIRTMPWFFWGHSGGGTWSWLMFHRHPRQFAGIVLRSGPTVAPEPCTLSPEVPVLCNLGVREREHAHYRRIWDLSWSIFTKRSQAGSPVTMAVDPGTEHECGLSRFLCLPFIDACLKARLPASGEDGAPLRTLAIEDGWVGDLDSLEIAPWKDFRGDRSRATWLIDEPFARRWREYCRTATVRSLEAPERAPWALAAEALDVPAVRLTWRAAASMDGGIRTFRIYRDGAPLSPYARTPSDPKVPHDSFQAPNYHDTLDPPLARMEFLDRDAAQDAEVRYQVSLVDWSDRESPRSEAVTVRTRG